jgi:hypothetical protein
VRLRLPCSWRTRRQFPAAATARLASARRATLSRSSRSPASRSIHTSAGSPWLTCTQTEAVRSWRNARNSGSIRVQGWCFSASACQAAAGVDASTPSPARTPPGAAGAIEGRFPAAALARLEFDGNWSDLEPCSLISVWIPDERDSPKSRKEPITLLCACELAVN